MKRSVVPWGSALTGASADLARVIDRARPAPRRSLLARAQTLLHALGVEQNPTSADELVGLLETRLSEGRADETWLALAVLTAQLPDAPAVIRTLRRIRLDGAAAALSDAVATALHGYGPHPDVEILVDRVAVDIHITSLLSVSTGIQRVVRMTCQQWYAEHDPVFLHCPASPRAYGRLSREQAERSLFHSEAIAEASAARKTVVVPWRCTYVLPELQADPERSRYIHAMTQYSGNVIAAIGFDLVPITSADTVNDGVANGFAAGLATLTHADRIATISEGARVEYAGWKRMLAGTGLVGPEIRSIPLPEEAVATSAADLDRARELLVLGAMPMLLVVGSHEPRKNHLAVLHAAELLWREGRQFSLVFIGGSGWKSERFDATVERLQATQRPVTALRASSDELLWAAYRLARFTIFPSLNEGFGLPVAESLAVGTPVITSGFGSMAEIAAGGGALLVDPRDDHGIADAIRDLLVDEPAYVDLRAAAAARPVRTWSMYAAETWEYLVHGQPELVDPPPLAAVIDQSQARTETRS